MIVPQNNPEETPIQTQAVLPKREWIKPKMTDITLLLNTGAAFDGEAQGPRFGS